MNLAWDWKVVRGVCFVCANDEGWNEGWYAESRGSPVDENDPFWDDKKKPCAVVAATAEDTICLCQKHLTEAAVAIRDAIRTGSRRR